MTTLVAVRQPPLEVSMSNKPDRRPGKRLAAAVDYENDGDFQFARKPKKAKTTEESHQPVRRSPRGKPPATIPDEQPQLVVRKNASRQSTKAQQADKNTDTRNNKGRASSSSSSRRHDRFESPERTTIALHMADTPVMDRNKEMRKKGGSSTPGRRSSLGSRGRRASLLLENGQSAIPHREVDAAHFYKHISTKDLSEPRRMMQLLTWCGERALAEKPGHGTANSNVILGARAIQSQLWKDFEARLELSDWQRRDSDTPVPPIPRKPNPRNLELDKKAKSLEARIKRLQEEQSSWQSIQKPPPSQPPPLFLDDTNTTSPSSSSQPPQQSQSQPQRQKPPTIQLPDPSLLEADEVSIRTYLAAEMEPFESVRVATQARLAQVQRGLEFQVDHLADNVHKLEQRVRAAGGQADRVLRLAAARLKEREDRERRSAGTKDMPIMEVLRSLGGLLPEGRGGEG